MSILDDDINAFDSKKSKLLHGNVQIVESLLNEVGFEPEEIEVTDVDSSKFGGDNAAQPMHVKSLSSGKFSSLLLAIVFAVASVVAWVYFATEKLGLTLDLHKVPTPEVQSQILSWIGGGIIGGQGNPLIGMAILGLSAILVMWIVYALRVSMRANKNLKIAQQVNKDAKFYCTKKEECKKEMEKVSSHIHKVIASLHTYDIYFDELNATMERIIYLEGKIPFNEYHSKSKEEMKGATILVNSLNELISTPMAGENGSLSKESSKVLERSNRTLEHYREKLYL